MRINPMRFLLALAAVMLVVVQTDAADDQRPPANGIESLGHGLLEDLAPDVSKPPTATKKEQQDRRELGSPQPRFDDLGEDIGTPSGPLSLARVRQGMQQAESFLAGPAAADAGTVQ